MDVVVWVRHRTAPSKNHMKPRQRRWTKGIYKTHPALALSDRNSSLFARNSLHGGLNWLCQVHRPEVLKENDEIHTSLLGGRDWALILGRKEYGAMDTEVSYFLSLPEKAKLRRGPQTGWKFPLGFALRLSEYRDLFHGPPPAYKVSLHVSVIAGFSKALKIEETWQPCFPLGRIVRLPQERRRQALKCSHWVGGLPGPGPRGETRPELQGSGIPEHWEPRLSLFLVWLLTSLSKAEKQGSSKIKSVSTVFIFWASPQRTSP